MEERIKRCARRVLLLAGIAVLVVSPAGAGAAHEEPEIEQRPAIEGTAQVGETLREVAAEWSPEDAEATFTWLRCTGSGVGSCALIPGAQGRQYVVRGDDVGMRLRVWLTVTDEGEDEHAVSRATEVVNEAPPPPPPPVVAPPVIAPPVVAPPTATDPPAGDVRGERARPRARMLRPFPVVRIRGWLTPRGAMVRLLTVRTPRAVRVSVRCRGEGCPRRRWARNARRSRVTRLRAFEGFLRAGVRLRIRVTRPGWIGKHTEIQIRRGRAPARTDRCLYPGRAKPARCVRR